MPSFDVEIARARTVRIEDEIARRGIKLCGRGVDRCGPCPVCGGHDRFSINIRKQVFRCRPFSGGDTIALVQHLDDCGFKAAIEKLVRDWSMAPVRPAPARPESPGLYECRQHQKAAWLWRRGQSITGTIAEKYLCSRGINSPLPATLRYLPPSKPEHQPAMMAAFGLADEPEPGVPAAPHRVDAVHLTILRPDGAGKAEVPKPKISIGAHRGSPIVLAPANDLLGVAITEGIEDGLSVFEATGLGVWAAGSATRMPALADAIPSYIGSVTIYAHSDDAGRRGAQELAEALSGRGVEVFVEGLRQR